MFIGLSVTSAVIERIRARGPSKGAASLMDTWVFGCPPDPTEVRGCLSYQQISATQGHLSTPGCFGCPPDPTEVSLGLQRDWVTVIS